MHHSSRCIVCVCRRYIEQTVAYREQTCAAPLCERIGYRDDYLVMSTIREAKAYLSMCVSEPPRTVHRPQCIPCTVHH